MIKTSLFVAAAMALSAPAIAADAPAGAVVRAVQFDDLNLESDAGRAQLERRLVRAAESICATSPVPDSAAVRAERDACVAEIAAGFDAQMTAAVKANRARATAYASR